MTLQDAFSRFAKARPEIAANVRAGYPVFVHAEIWRENARTVIGCEKLGKAVCNAFAELCRGCEKHVLNAETVPYPPESLGARTQSRPFTS